jgi:hypothetical protein
MTAAMARRSIRLVSRAKQLGLGRGCSGQPIQQAPRYDDRPADDDRRERLDL